MAETVLPGDIIPASHVNLKLGPGLVQIFKPSGEKIVLATKAGELMHTSNNKNWWIESNSKRVSPFLQNVRFNLINIL